MTVDNQHPLLAPRHRSGNSVPLSSRPERGAGGGGGNMEHHPQQQHLALTLGAPLAASDFHGIHHHHHSRDNQQQHQQTQQQQQQQHPVAYTKHKRKGSSKQLHTSSSARPNKGSSFTLGQVVLFISIGTSVAAMMTVLLAVHAFTNSLHAHLGTMNATSSAKSPLSSLPLSFADSFSTSSRSLRTNHYLTEEHQLQPADAATAVSVPQGSDETEHAAPTQMTDPKGDDSSSAASHKPDNPSPKLIWLMSFPNSGTSFTIHMTREATNCTTATNYGLEGEIRDQPSVPAIQGPAGVNGPWLELLPTKTTRIADTILVKTHCKGFCSGSFCGADKTFHTTRSFMMGCLTGNQGVSSSKGMRLVDKTYDKSLVKKAIHLFRHPLDNVVARFHLEYNEKSAAGDTRYASVFTKDVTGFRRWCALDDRNRGLVQSRYIDPRLRGLMLQIPCFNEFYRYTQWHNLAFETTRAMNLTTMRLHYHEFADDFVATRGRVLSFLELPQVGEGIEFDERGKEYGHYYTRQEKVAIANFLQEFATAETWEQLKDYDFQTTEPNQDSSTM